MNLRLMFARLAQDLLYHPIRRTRSPLGNTYQDLVSIFCPMAIRLRNKNIGIHPTIGRYYKGKLLLHLYHSNKGSTLALQHLGNLSLELLPTAWKDIYLHPIAMQSLVEQIVGNKYILLQVLTHYISIPTGGHIHHPLVIVSSLLRRLEVPLRGLLNMRLLDQLGQGSNNIIAHLGRGSLELLGDLLP